MGKNKLAKFALMDTYPHVFQYPWARLQKESFPLKGCWRRGFFGNDNPIVLELGCGRGEYTVGLGQRFADKNFIGIDIKGSRMWTGARESLERGLRNVAFVRTEIEQLEHFFAEDEVDEIWITFPDPQMKKVRKRLTSTTFLERYGHVLKEGGLVHLKTDSPFLYTYTKAMAELNGLLLGVDTDDLYAGDLESEILEIRTYYEEQWLRRGLTIKYIQFAFRSPLQTWQEPDIEIEPDSYRSYGRNARSLLSLQTSKE